MGRAGRQRARGHVALLPGRFAFLAVLAAGAAFAGLVVVAGVLGSEPGLVAVVPGGALTLLACLMVGLLGLLPCGVLAALLGRHVGARAIDLNEQYIRDVVAEGSPDSDTA